MGSVGRLGSLSGASEFLEQISGEKSKSESRRDSQSKYQGILFKWKEFDFIFLSNLIIASQSSTVSSTSKASSAQQQARPAPIPGQPTLQEDAEDTMKNLRKTFAGIFGDMQEIAQKKKQQRGGSISSLSSIFGSKDIPDSPKPVAPGGPPSHPPPPAPVGEASKSTSQAQLASSTNSNRGTDVSSFESRIEAQQKASFIASSSSSTTVFSSFPTTERPQWYSPKKTVPEPLLEQKSDTSTPKTSSLSSQDSISQIGSSRGSFTSNVSPVVSGYSSMSQSSLDKSSTFVTSATIEKDTISYSSSIITQASIESKAEIPKNQTIIPSSSTMRTGKSESSYIPEVASSINKAPISAAKTLTRMNSDADIIFGDQPLDFYKSRVGFTTQSSTDRKSTEPTSSFDSQYSYKSNTSLAGNTDTKTTVDVSSRIGAASRQYEGIQNVAFQDFDSPTTKITTQSSKSWTSRQNDDDEYDLK